MQSHDEKICVIYASQSHVKKERKKHYASLFNQCGAQILKLTIGKFLVMYKRRFLPCMQGTSLKGKVNNIRLK